MSPQARVEARASELVRLDEARQLVLDSVKVLSSEVAPLQAALGCVTNEMVLSPCDVPSFSNSSMDGYALHASDTSDGPVRLRVVGNVFAGERPVVAVNRGEAMKIMTGAPMPELADAVVMVEQTRAEDEWTVVVERTVESGSNVRRPGEDIKKGDVVLDPGTVLGPAHIGVLASLGIASVAVHRTPRVGVLSTGDELVGPGDDTVGDESAKIHDSNRPVLVGLLRRAGFEPVDLGVVGDDEEKLAAVLSESTSQCDAVLTSGGVSMGDVDFVKVVLDTLSNGNVHWLKVAIKPAKPFAFALIGERRVPVFGLAGNPVSAVVGFELFARPALRKMAGHRVLDRPLVKAVTEVPLDRHRDGKLHLVRVVLTQDGDGRFKVRPSGGQASHMLLAMARANAFALVPDGTGIAAGGLVDVMLLEPQSIGGSSEWLCAPRGST